jgi:hypothetical protein
MTVKNRKTKKEKIPCVKPTHWLIKHYNILEEHTTDNVAIAIVSLTKMLKENKDLPLKELLELYSFGGASFPETENILIRLKMTFQFLKVDVVKLSFFDLFYKQACRTLFLIDNPNLVIDEPSFLLSVSDFFFCFF